MGSAQLGQLGYYYDPDGRVSRKAGSLASIRVPQSVNGNIFNADNAMTTFGSQTLSGACPECCRRNANGNLTSDGANAYSWDARRHLSAVSGFDFASFVGACPERAKGTGSTWRRNSTGAARWWPTC